MKSLKASKYFEVINPSYVYLRIKPNNSIRNNNTYKIARTIASIYKTLWQSVKREDEKIMRVIGREFTFGTRYSYTQPSKVSYYVYIEKQKVEFYFIIPKQHLTVIKEKITDSWKGITIEQVDDIPSFDESATKYQLNYSKEDAMSLAVDRRENDLLRSNLNIIDVLEEGDKVGIFYNFLPTTQFTWRSKYENTINKVKNNRPIDRNKMDMWYVLKLAFSYIFQIVDDIGTIIGGESQKKAREETASTIETALAKLTGASKYGKNTENKGSETILETQIMVLSESKEKQRERNNAKSLAQSFDTITDDNKLVAKRINSKFEPLTYRIKKAETNRMSSVECGNFIAAPGRELLEQYDFVDKIETQETQVPEDLRKGVIRIGTSTYRGVNQHAYLSTDSEYRMLTTMLIGPTRAGKSTLIGNMAYDTLKAGECTIIFDYIGNCELSNEVSGLFTPDKVLNIECNDFESIQGLGYNEVPFSEDPYTRYANAKKQTTQLKTLVNSINSDDTPLSARMNRFLTSAALVVFISGGPIKDVFGVLQNHTKRSQYVSKIPKSQHENMEEYIGYLSELDDYDKDGNVKGSKLHLVEGIISRLNVLKDNAYIEMMLKKDTANNIDLVEELQKPQLICIKMPESMFSTDNERDIYATYWITKLWLALQMRKAKFNGDRSKMTKVNLVIDELYQIENTEMFLTKKLNRLAKFNLKPIISCHHLDQLKHMKKTELKSANASYMLIAGCDKENYNELQADLYPFTLEDLLNMKRYHSMNLIKNKERYARFITKLPGPVGEKKKDIEKVNKITFNGKVVEL